MSQAIETNPLDITDEQRANLEKLANWLINNADQIDFSMTWFATSTVIEDEDDRLLDEPFSFMEFKEKHRCGSVGCAVGHGPLAGIQPLENENWNQYASRNFGTEIEDGLVSSGDLWAWLFDSDWDETDNTAIGAGKRILWTLKNGVPTSNVRRNIVYDGGDLPYAV